MRLAERFADGFLQHHPDEVLRKREIAAIHLYTQSKKDGKHCRLFAYMNAALNSGKKERVRPYFKYVVLSHKSPSFFDPDLTLSHQCVRCFLFPLSPGTFACFNMHS